MFNLQKDYAKRLAQVEFWIQSVLHHISKGKCILVGTHATGVPNAIQIVNEVFETMNQKFPGRIHGKFAVDSLDGFNIEILKQQIYQFAQSQVFIFHSIF